jgi:NAD(P)-dependent dehydrogenase (short-subunit alcohol dehydrogenase family)
MPVSGLVVLITGAARGMGREYVRAFLKEGAKVIATDGLWTPTGVSGDDFDFRQEIEANPDVLIEKMDITIDSHIKRVYESAMDRFGTVDVIVNNAGLRARDLYPPLGNRPIIETELGDWWRMFDTHVFGTFRVIKTFVQPMIAQKRGSIVNVCSGGGGGASLEGPYQPAKAAETMMTLFLANELKQYNIAANVLLPGFTRTTGTDEQTAARQAIFERNNPGKPYLVRRLRPESAVPLALHLAEQDASGITGETFSVPAWNQENELGGFETWGYGPDVEAARAAGTL